MDASTMAQVDAMVQAAVAPAHLAQQVGIAVLDRALDTGTVQNAALLDMMRSTLDPTIGSHLDLRV